MDFYAKIHIGDKVKTFPVREGNSLRDLNWQFATTINLGSVTTLIEIWDEDDAICGGGDDEVCVKGNLNKIRQSFNTRENLNQSYRSVGTVKAGSERAGITYTIIIEPIKSKTELLSQGIWKQLIIEHRSRETAGIWLPDLQPAIPVCKRDDLYVFRVN
jgi:hypothetical protein